MLPALKSLVNNKKWQNRFLVMGAVFLLILQFAIQLHLAAVDGETTDETSHLNAAYSYITTGQFRFNPEHPPLAKELSGLALLHLHPKTSPEMTQLFNNSSNFFYDSWENNLTSASILTYQIGNNANQLIFWGRIPYVAITTILGASIFLIALYEWGTLAGLVATTIYVFDPTVAGHGHLMTTDISAALGYLWVIYTSWKFFVRPTWWWAAGLGTAVAVGLLLKYTVVIALPVILLFFVAAWILSKNRSYWREVVPKLGLTLAVMMAIIWAGYGFHDRVAPAASSFTSEINYVGSHNGSLAGYVPPTSPAFADKTYTVIRPLLDLLPGDFVKGMYMVIAHGDSGGQSEYLLGQTSSNGWWYYFPVILILKTPLPTLLLTVVAFGWIIWKRPNLRLVMAILGAALAFLGIAIFSKADLGIRYILPLLPLLALVIAAAVSHLPKLYYLNSALLVWLVVIFFASYPYYIGYFNNFVGGSYHGYQLRSDSDVDWGQDIKRIADYIHQNNISNVYVDYTWDSDPALDYYIGKGQWQPISSWQPGDEGTAIVSASAWNTDQATQSLHNSSSCSDLHQLTPSVLICTLH